MADMTLDAARIIGTSPHTHPDVSLHTAALVLNEEGDDSDERLIDKLWDELGRREDVEPPYDTPSLEDRGITRPTYGD